jgi:hypothetical protein
MHADRKVRMSVFGKLKLAAHSHGDEYRVDGSKVPPRSVLIIQKQMDTPSRWGNKEAVFRT